MWRQLLQIVYEDTALFFVLYCDVGSEMKRLKNASLQEMKKKDMGQIN